MRQLPSIRIHLAAVFLLFFALVAVLGMFNLLRLRNFNLLSAEVAEIWPPTMRAVGDLNNYTSDFRAIEGGNLLASDAAGVAASEKNMAGLDRSIAGSERAFEAISHDVAVENLYRDFVARWAAYRVIVNQMLELSRSGQKSAALAIYNGSSRTAYDTASDTLGQLTDHAVADAKVASDRLRAAYRRFRIYQRETVVTHLDLGRRFFILAAGLFFQVAQLGGLFEFLVGCRRLFFGLDLFHLL